jgi:uncharacterized protein HemX
MPAFLAGPLLKWAIIGLVIAGLVAAVIWQTHEVKVAREAQAVAERQAAISTQDAARWQAASDVRDARLAQLSAALDEQSAVIQQGRAKQTELLKSLDSARLENDRLSAEADQLSKDANDEATKAPGDIRQLGPIILRRAPSLLN